jgi:superfamily II DNA/RNA helicase
MSFQPQLQRLNIKALNKMQEATIAACSKNNDVVLHSPTGSGKTLAFLLPILKSLDQQEAGVQALVIAPSRELAIQIEQVFRKMGTGYKVSCCYGGHAVKTERQNLIQPPAVLIGTPGRLADHLRREHFDPTSIQTLVLDEFDKALELGFEKDMAFIVRQMEQLQKRILTSATKAINIPAFVGVASPYELDFLKKAQPLQLTVKKVVAEGNDKLETLLRLLCKTAGEPTLVFCNHRDAVERISALLADEGLAHDTFHGGLKQDTRERALIKFRNGSHQILITTDLASRGLDIPEIQQVVHYQLPLKKEAFIHRNGRTARMHAKGIAYLVLAEEEQLPEFIKDAPEMELFPEDLVPPTPPKWETLYISGGKKNKINKIDIVGLLHQKGNLKKDDVGLIEVLDYASYVAINRNKLDRALKLIRGEKLKKQRVKFMISR